MTPDADAVRDALALIEAVHRNDDEAIEVLLGNADLRETALSLATIAEGVIGSLATFYSLQPSDVLAQFRAWSSDD